MCVILDASARDNVFGKERTVAGKQFFDWLETSAARLIIGGKLTEELAGNPKFEEWATEAIADGRVRTISDGQIGQETERLSAQWAGRSNDQHVIALARISRARVLFANDTRLRDDFRNLDLVPKPQGKLLPDGESANAAQRRKQLLRQTDLCPNR